MSNTLSIKIDRSERSIIRVLSIIERRGFEISSLDCPKEAAADAPRVMRVGIDSRYGERAISTLARQITRLQNVQGVETGPSRAMPQPEAHAVQDNETMMMTPPRMAGVSVA